MPTFLTRRQAFFSSMSILVAVSSMNAFPNLAFALPQANGRGKSAQLPSASNMKTIGLIGGTFWYSWFRELLSSEYHGIWFFISR